MSHEWNDLLPSLMEEFSSIGLGRRPATPEEVTRLKALEKLSDGNCQTLLYGLAAAGCAFTNGAEALNQHQIRDFGYFVQLVATLGADLANVNSYVTDVLGRLPEEVRDAAA